MIWLYGNGKQEKKSNFILKSDLKKSQIFPNWGQSNPLCWFSLPPQYVRGPRYWWGFPPAPPPSALAVTSPSSVALTALAPSTSRCWRTMVCIDLMAKTTTSTCRTWPRQTPVLTLVSLPTTVWTPWPATVIPSTCWVSGDKDYHNTTQETRVVCCMYVILNRTPGCIPNIEFMTRKTILHLYFMTYSSCHYSLKMIFRVAPFLFLNMFIK